MIWDCILACMIWHCVLILCDLGLCSSLVWYVTLFLFCIIWDCVLVLYDMGLCVLISYDFGLCSSLVWYATVFLPCALWHVYLWHLVCPGHDLICVPGFSMQLITPIRGNGGKQPAHSLMSSAQGTVSQKKKKTRRRTPLTFQTN